MVAPQPKQEALMSWLIVFERLVDMPGRRSVGWLNLLGSWTCWRWCCSNDVACFLSSFVGVQLLDVVKLVQDKLDGSGRG